MYGSAVMCSQKLYTTWSIYRILTATKKNIFSQWRWSSVLLNISNVFMEFADDMFFAVVFWWFLFCTRCLVLNLNCHSFGKVHQNPIKIRQVHHGLQISWWFQYTLWHFLVTVFKLYIKYHGVIDIFFEEIRET